MIEHLYDSDAVLLCQQHIQARGAQPMSNPREHPGEGPIPADSYAAWWVDAHVADDVETQRLREELERQYREAGVD